MMIVFQLNNIQNKVFASFIAFIGYAIAFKISSNILI